MHGSWLRLGKKVIQSNFGTLALPYKLSFAVTQECHSRCENCRTWQVSPKDELSLEEVRRLARNTPFLSWLSLTGGEPTDRSDLVEIARAFQEHCKDLLLVNLPTNGLDSERVIHVCTELAELRFSKLVVTVSIDGPPDVHADLRGIEDGFDRAVRTYAALRRIKGVAAFVGMTLYESNAGLIDATVAAITEKVPDFTLSDLHLNIGHVSEHFYGSPKVDHVSAPKIAQVMRDFVRMRGLPGNPLEFFEWRYQRRVAQYVRSGKVPIRCAAVMSSCHLSETGTLYPCSIWGEALGNIRDHGYSLVPMIRSRQAEELRVRIAAKACPNCWSPCEAIQSLAANLVTL